MNPIFEFLFGQYSGYELNDVVLEVIAVIFGFISVWCSKENNVFVFPTGIISTVIFVYLLFKWELLGDMMINAYYFIMSLYGWYVWTLKVDKLNVTPITRTVSKEKKVSTIIFLVTLLFVYLVYQFFDKWTSWVAYVDTITTAIFFVGMWLMARRKLEHWLFWIVGDLISVPLYFYKGFTFTSLQYLGFTFIAIYGYIAWKKNINSNFRTA
ncbi:nicotinamide mononucleotide transporter [Flavivirga aquatica]|uniref:Nicotinamide riboside transporter PnuC n=1 Tax=Flavivirga aquatica TaxID=1849968 RepID=A0A1E5TD52_9FLAO|nr:nicotinamide riboside transporter PnuC [Flavivirga aquatica]OEK09304.1 nicotinamide mononucleotide transporter [Flavivirga aquatica]